MRHSKKRRTAEEQHAYRESVKADPAKYEAQEQRAYRETVKADPSKYEAYKEREKKRRQRRKAEKKLKAIGDMTEREKRAKRQYWREDNRKRAARVATAAVMKDNGTTALNTTPKTETQPDPGGVICILGNIDVKHN